MKANFIIFQLAEIKVLRQIEAGLLNTPASEIAARIRHDQI
jgi:hypothetical protein